VIRFVNTQQSASRSLRASAHFDARRSREIHHCETQNQNTERAEYFQPQTHHHISISHIADSASERSWSLDRMPTRHVTIHRASEKAPTKHRLPLLPVARSRAVVDTDGRVVGRVLHDDER
jgi:hypothetical protein